MLLRAGVICVLLSSAAAVAEGKSVRPAIVPSAKAISLENKRALALQSFEVVIAAQAPAREIVVGKLDKPLATGERVDLALNGARGCIFQARWVFDDITDSGDVDLCSNAHIVLAD